MPAILSSCDRAARGLTAYHSTCFSVVIAAGEKPNNPQSISATSQGLQDRHEQTPHDDCLVAIQRINRSRESPTFDWDVCLSMCLSLAFVLQVTSIIKGGDTYANKSRQN